MTAAAAGGLLASGMFVGSAQAYPVNDPQITTDAVGYGLGHVITIHITNVLGPVDYKTWLVRIAPCVGNVLPEYRQSKFFYGLRSIPAGATNGYRRIVAPKKERYRGRYQARIQTFSPSGAPLYTTNTNITIGC